MKAHPCTCIDSGNILVANLQVLSALSPYLANGPDLTGLRTLQRLVIQYSMNGRRCSDCEAYAFARQSAARSP